MIVCKKDKIAFIQDVRDDTIAEQVEQCVLEKLGRKTGRSEFDTWRNSLGFMRNAIEDVDIPSDCRVSIEFQLPSTSKRIDLMVPGADFDGNNHHVIVELKQWS